MLPAQWLLDPETAARLAVFPELLQQFGRLAAYRAFEARRSAQRLQDACRFHSSLDQAAEIAELLQQSDRWTARAAAAQDGWFLADAPDSGSAELAPFRYLADLAGEAGRLKPGG